MNRSTYHNLVSNTCFIHFTLSAQRAKASFLNVIVLSAIRVDSSYLFMDSSIIPMKLICSLTMWISQPKGARATVDPLEQSRWAEVICKASWTNLLTALSFVIVTSLSVLSAQPHQETRFLIPLLVPILVLLARTGRLENLEKQFWVSQCTLMY